MLGLACLCSSFTQVLARANVSWSRAGNARLVPRCEAGAVEGTPAAA